jgi:hypothetical protein
MAEYSEEVAYKKILRYANEEFVIDLGTYFAPPPYGSTALRGPMPRHFTTLHDHALFKPGLDGARLVEWRDVTCSANRSEQKRQSGYTTLRSSANGGPAALLG